MTWHLSLPRRFGCPRSGRGVKRPSRTPSLTLSLPDIGGTPPQASYVGHNDLQAFSMAQCQQRLHDSQQLPWLHQKLCLPQEEMVPRTVAWELELGFFQHKYIGPVGEKDDWKPVINVTTDRQTKLCRAILSSKTTPQHVMPIFSDYCIQPYRIPAFLLTDISPRFVSKSPEGLMCILQGRALHKKMHITIIPVTKQNTITNSSSHACFKMFSNINTIGIYTYSHFCTHTLPNTQHNRDDTVQLGPPVSITWTSHIRQSYSSAE